MDAFHSMVVSEKLITCLCARYREAGAPRWYSQQSSLSGCEMLYLTRVSVCTDGVGERNLLLWCELP